VLWWASGASALGCLNFVNFIPFCNFKQNQTEIDRYWQKHEFLLLAKKIRKITGFDALEFKEIHFIFEVILER
jgi:hypothetical protein